jgi:cytochrome c oxidase subunit III
LLEMRGDLPFQFEDHAQMHESYRIGMWVFLATEIMLFGVLFMAYTVYYSVTPTAFAEASRHMNLPLGTLNTAVLLTSSLTMALGIQRLQWGRPRQTLMFLAATLVLGLAFLGIKYVEYSQHYHEHLFPGPWFAFEGPDSTRVQLFVYFYFAMTGLHALHMTAGVLVVALMMLLVWIGHLRERNYIPLDLTGLYWHFVDLVWIFLFPIFYLPGVHLR